MHSAYFRAIVVLFLCTALFGCTVRRVNFNEPITQDTLSFIRPGETTLHQVVGQLGAPEDIGSVSDQLVAEFKWSTTRSSSINFGHIFRVVSPVAPPMTLSGAGIHIQRLLVFCDRHLIVRSYALGLTDEHTMFEFWPF